MKKILIACLVVGTALIAESHELRTSNHWLLASLCEMFGLICAMEFVCTLEENLNERGDK